MKNFPARLDKIARVKAIDSDKIEIWLVDEARIEPVEQDHPSLGEARHPSLRTSRPTHRFHLHFRRRLPKGGQGGALILPAGNTEAMNLYLAEITAIFASGAHAVLLVDRADWHLSARLVAPPNITIFDLPPKSPELNPVENVWQFMRDHWLSNRTFKSYDNPVDRCYEAWKKLVAQPLVHHAHRVAPMGAWVLINGTRYKPVSIAITTESAAGFRHRGL